MYTQEEKIRKNSLWIRICVWFCWITIRNPFTKWFQRQLDIHAWNSGVTAGFLACSEAHPRIPANEMARTAIYLPYGKLWYRSIDMYEMGVETAVVFYRIGFKTQHPRITFGSDNHLNSAFYCCMDGDVYPDPRPLPIGPLRDRETKLNQLYAKYAEESQQTRNAPL